NSTTFADKHLAQLLTNFLHLLIRNGLTGHHRVFRLRVFHKLLKSLLVSRLFEEGIEVCVCWLNWRRALFARLLRKALRDHDSPHQIHLALDLRTIGESL